MWLCRPAKKILVHEVLQLFLILAHLLPVDFDHHGVSLTCLVDASPLLQVGHVHPISVEAAALYLRRKKLALSL
jgi:hypothetical protein